MQMEISMKVSGKMIRLMAWAIISMQMELHIMESGKMISNTVKVLRRGLIVLDMKDFILKAKSTVKELYALLMDQYTLVIFNIMKFQERVNMYGLMVNHMKANGRKIKCMAMEF